MQWFYAENGQQIGPMEQADIERLASEGRIHDQTLVWCQGMKDWQAYSVVKRAFPQAVAQQQAITVAQVQPGADAPVRCHSCGQDVAREEAVQFQDAWVCAKCKPGFFQRLHEGGGPGNMPISEIFKVAWQAMRGSWGSAFVAVLIAGIITIAATVPCAILFAGMGLGSDAGIQLGNYLGQFLVGGAIAYGLCAFYLSVVRGTGRDLGLIFSGFRRYGTTMLAMVLIQVFVFLWMLLLYIPGIIAQYRYSQSFYILTDSPQLDAMTAIKISRAMMKGRKWKRFLIDVVVGVATLAIMTPAIVGVMITIGTNQPIWLLLIVPVIPFAVIISLYAGAVGAVFYNDVKDSVNLPQQQ